MKMNALTKATTEQLDGFAGYNDRTEGGEPPQAQGGPLVRFTNQATWTCNGEPLPAGREYVGVDIAREVIKWPPGDDRGGPIDRIVLGPNEPYPDIKQLNTRTPRTEWRVDLNGELVGPWVAQHILYMVDTVTTERLVFPTGTVGGAIAIKRLRQCVMDRRAICGASNLVAMFTLGDANMRTAYGPRRRPHFNVVRFIALGGEQPPALPPAEHTVELPPLKQDLKDDIVF
jgi:hypothetical protein